jgi:hypothetical protein
MRNSLWALLVVLSACSSTKISYDYDQSADFSKYKTYAFTTATSELPLDDINKNRMINAVVSELALKGLTKSDQPDVWVDLHLKTEKRVEATATTTGGGYRYGYGAVGMSTTQVSYDEYTDGSLFITLVDPATEKAVWQGVGTKTIEENSTPEQREKAINYAVKQILYNYPPKK